MSVLENLQIVQDKMEQACAKVNRKIDEITIIGVTKYVPIERAEELVNAGVLDLGENRPEELIHKSSVIRKDVSWHFIGTLQSRKVKDVIDKVTSIHSLDRLSIAKQINNRSADIIDCFVQVNVSGEASKHGLTIEQVIPFIADLKQFEKVRIVGLMTMAPDTGNTEEIRSVFKTLANLRKTIQEKAEEHAPCNYLSMGMSNDYEIAIEEGATHIRLGSTLVGK